jgi:hypothetical protein
MKNWKTDLGVVLLAFGTYSTAFVVLLLGSVVVRSIDIDVCGITVSRCGALHAPAYLVADLCRICRRAACHRGVAPAFLASMAQRSLAGGHPADLIGGTSRMFESSCMAVACAPDFIAA